MTHWFDETLGGRLVAWVSWVERHARLVAVGEFAVTLVLAALFLPRLAFNMDHKQLADPDLPFQQAAAAFARYFPPLDDTLLVVVDAPTQEAARAAAATLADRLRGEKDAFSDVYLPGAGPFFERHALLYRTPDELDDFVDHLATVQPILGELSRDPSIANLARLVRIGLQHERSQGRSAEAWSVVLDRMADATVRVFDEYPLSISWEDVMLQGSALEGAGRQIIIVEPVLDFDKLLVAEEAIVRIRTAARDIPSSAQQGIRVRITGNPALNYEEMLGLAWDIGYSSLLCFVLVLLILFAALRSARLVTAAALTLVVGLLWTSVFVVVAIGKLNVLSIAFAVLFIGLGVDFAIHLGMYYAEAARSGIAGTESLRHATKQAGSSLVICALTTTIGFYAFVPTPYRGVAELGLISGTGMIFILFHSFTCFPALVTLLLGDEVRGGIRDGFRVRLAPPRLLARHDTSVALVAALIGVAAAFLLPHLRFDASVINIRDPDTESVQTFNDLLADSHTSPWYVDAIAPNVTLAEDLSHRLRNLEEVENAITVTDFVPADQDEKREILEEASLMLDVPTGALPPATAPSIAEQIETLRDLYSELNANWLGDSKAPLAPTARRLRDELGTFLDHAERDGDPAKALADLERILLSSFPRQVKRLQRALHPSQVTLETLPAELTLRMLASDGHARIQAFPKGSLDDGHAMARFVDAVRTIAPDATGVAVNVVELGRVTVAALKQALLSAFVAIAIMILLLFQRLRETILVLAPVVLAAILTGATMVLLDLPFNFVNVVVLPLLLGIGVDSGIHLVHRATSTATDLLETTTARAVFYSALTTVLSFGSLAFSSHRGVASMGILLVCGMLIMLACNLVVLPALVSLWLRLQPQESK